MLVVSLIMLAVMTLFVISMLKTSIIELKIGGASQVAAVNFANAEVAINNFLNANNGRFAPGFLEKPTVVINLPPLVYGGSVAIAPRQLSCGPWAPFGTMIGGLHAAQFDVMATATGALGGTARLHQGVESLAPPGSCL